jgi:xylulokinase
MFLGIDLGTSGVKAVLLDENDAIIAEATASLEVSRPQALWSEQDPEDWWRATCEAIANLRARDVRSFAAVQAIGLSGQMHGATLLGEDDKPLRPAILWNDGRSEAQCAQLEAAVPTSRAITGNLAMPGFTAPKLLWVREHEPETFARIASVLLPKDYLRLRMTGDRATDLSDASGTLWIDVAKRAWSSEMLEASGLSVDAMPRAYEGTEITGTLRADIASEWGCLEVPVVAGAGDQAAGAAGAGVVSAGQAILSLGTSGVYFAATSSFLPNPDRAVHAFCHCFPDTWHQMSVMLSAASCLSWAAKLTGSENEAALLAKIDASTSRNERLLFLPYLSGERTPHNDPHAAGVLFGIDHATDAAALGRAVLEGVAFAFADGQDALLAAGGDIETVSVIGGGSRSVLWGTILASALDRPLIYRKGGEVGPALGAARLARIGLTNEPLADVCAELPEDFIALPDAALRAQYSTSRSRFVNLYPALRESFRDTGEPN